jgi:PST family polysaccharide transporter
MINRQYIQSFWRSNTKVAENYLFMTLLQVLNVCFYLFIYPFLIRTLGTEAYGLYAYAVALVAIFITFVSFGFDLPAAKRIAEHATDIEAKSTVLSEITLSKLLLEIIAVVIYCVLMYVSPLMRAHYVLFAVAFMQTVTNIVFPQWYFQGVQRMKVVTYVQVAFKFASLPFIFWLIRTPDDVDIYMLIATLTMLAGGMTAWIIIRKKDKIRFRLVPWTQVMAATKEAFPFFLSNATGIIKEQGVVLIIGQLLGMSEVAIYDLANIIIIIPRTVLCKLSDAIYPKMMTGVNVAYRRKVVWAEVCIGLGAIVMVAALGYWAVLLLGGEGLIAAYPVSVILSVTVMTWLVAAALIYFYIIPSGKTYYITINQIIAMIVTFLIAGVGLYITHNVYVLASALAVAGLAEIGFCTYVVYKNQLI